jgi:hypothetical protein
MSMALLCPNWAALRRLGAQSCGRGFDNLESQTDRLYGTLLQGLLSIVLPTSIFLRCDMHLVTISMK